MLDFLIILFAIKFHSQPTDYELPSPATECRPSLSNYNLPPELENRLTDYDPQQTINNLFHS